MPEGITALTNNNRYWRQRNGDNLPTVTPDPKKEYYIVTDPDGRIYYEGRVDGVCNLFEITTEEFRDLELLKEPLPGGYSYIRQNKDDRHMRKKTMIYTVRKHDVEIFEGTLSETSTEIGINQSMICDLVRSQKAYLGQFTFTKHEEWI